MKEKSIKIIKNNLSVIISIIIFIILYFLPTGYENAVIYKDRERCTAKILSVDNSNINTIGVVSTGDQMCSIKFLDGKFKGETATGYNMLTGSLESDKIFKKGDKAFVLISHENDKINMVSMIDHYRINTQIILVVIFVIFLILVAGKTGVRAILSFGITIFSIWKILIPSYLNGLNPIYIGFLITGLLTIIIISLVFSFNKKMLAATIGSLTGTLVTMIIGIIFTDLFMLDGAIMPNSESLLHNGYLNINLKQLFIASIFIGSSGAVMDLAVDITSAVNEVVDKKSDITSFEAVKSGMNVGKAAMGTMTTTLLLAYSGGYISLLMVFMAQGTPIDNILNYKYVASEFLDTIVGSFGLVSVTPLTALCAGILLTNKKHNKTKKLYT